MAGSSSGAIGRFPMILRGYPAILGTPDLDAEFVKLWRKACKLAGIKGVPDGE